MGKYDHTKGEQSVYQGLDNDHENFLETLGKCLDGKGIPANFQVKVKNRGNSCDEYCWDERRNKWICC